MERPIPYKGDQPYVFISYAHKNNDKVHAIVARMLADGYRVWFDEGIDPGTEWDENIASHAKGCSFFIAFLSKDYLASANCRDELSYARDLNKERLLVYLEEVELPDGLKMRLNRLQAIHWYRYTNGSDSAFDKLYSTPGLGICHAAPKQSDASPKEQPGEPSYGSAPVPSETKKNPKWLIPTIIAVAVALIGIIISVAVGLSGDKNIPPAAEAPVASAAAPEAATEEVLPEIEPAAVEPIKNYYITLTAPDDMSVKGFNSAVATVKDRLNLLFCGAEYALEESENGFSFTLPEKYCGDYDVESLLRCYISRSMELYLFCSNYYEVAATPVPLARKDILAAEAKYGAVEGLSDEDRQKTGVGAGESFRYVELTLSDKGAAQIEAGLEQYGSSLTLAQDAENNSWFYFYLIAAEDSHHVYLTAPALNGQQGETFAALLAYNYTHEPLESNFNFEIRQNLDKSSLWQNPASASIAGEHQCRFDELTGDCVTFSLTASSSSSMTAGDWLDTETILKHRLDALDQPYAFAVDEDYTVIIKTSVNHVGTLITELLGKNYSSLEMLCGDMFLTYAYFDSVSVEELEDGSVALKLEVANYYLDDWTEYLAYARETGSDITLSVSIHGIKDSLLLVEPEWDGKTLTADRMADGSPISAENRWLLELLVAMSKEKLPCIYSPDVVQFSSDDLGYGFTLSICSKIRDVIRELYPDATVLEEYGYLRVFLQLSVDEDLPRQMLDAGKAIWNAVDFEAGKLPRLYIYLIDENDSENERCRIFLQKSMAYWYNLKNGDETGGRSVSMEGIFYGGRLEPLKETFRSLLAEDEFYRQYAGVENWIFEP